MCCKTLKKKPLKILGMGKMNGLSLLTLPLPTTGTAPTAASGAQVGASHPKSMLALIILGAKEVYGEERRFPLH